MYESKSLFGDYYEMSHNWAKIQAIDEVSAASIFVTEGLFIYIYFQLFEENHQNRISRAGEKISPTISLFFRKMIPNVSEFSYAKRFKD